MGDGARVGVLRKAAQGASHVGRENRVLCSDRKPLPNRVPPPTLKRARDEGENADGGRADDGRDIPVLIHRLSCGAYQPLSVRPKSKWYRAMRRRVGSHIPTTPCAGVIDLRAGLPVPSSKGGPLIASSVKRIMREREQARSSSMLFSMSNSMAVKTGREEASGMRAAFKQICILPPSVPCVAPPVSSGSLVGAPAAKRIQDYTQ
eukprot:IDg590t1